MSAAPVSAPAQDTPDAPPFFSVLICNYNYERFVGDAIRSALAQAYPRDRFEVIVIDDGSTDGSRDVLAGFAGTPGFRAILQENRGQSAAFEAGVLVAKGDYVCLLDSDDLYLPGKLGAVAAHIATLDAVPDRLFLCHDLDIDEVIGKGILSESWFDRVGVSRLGASARVSEVTRGFPFSIPAGLVLSRGLFADCLAALPVWAFPLGADGIVCPAALIACGTVHYLKQRLAVYRIHGANEFASLVDGVYVPRRDPRLRTPRSLKFLEQWIDLADIGAQARVDAFAYLRRIENMNRMPSGSRLLNAPVVAIAVLTNGSDEAVQMSVDSVMQQSHPALLLSLPEGVGQPTLPASGGPGLARFADDAGLPDFMRLGRAYASVDADFMVFLRAGDRLDREFVERHVHLHQHGLLAGVSCCDVRLAGQENRLLHASVFLNSGVWKQPEQRFFPFDIGLADWVGAPISACMFRRGELLDRLFTQPQAGAAADAAALAAAGFWLAFQFQLHTVGALRLLETLVTCRLPDGAAGSYGYMSAATRLDGTLAIVPLRDAALWLQEFYLDQEPAFRRWLPLHWHQNFELWLDRHTA